MKIYTRTGDSGTTGLFCGPRVAKNDQRIETFGTVDELNSILGVLCAHNIPEDIFEQIRHVQADLFTVGACLSTTDTSQLNIRLIDESDIFNLESWIDAHEEGLSPLKSFILPGGTIPAAIAHQARTVSRRAERRLVSLNLVENLEEYNGLIVYLNRLSDYLFVVGRALNHRANQNEPLWTGRKS